MNAFEQAETVLKEMEMAQLETVELAEEFRIKYLGSKGVLKELFAQMASVPNDRKKEFGQLMNKIKGVGEQKVSEAKERAEEQFEADKIPDLTAEPYLHQRGSLHPLRIVRNKMIEIFERIGFTVADGPEVDDDWHNFTALNMPKDHAARDMQDTFYIDENTVLRTHTSNVQVHVMENSKPPIRMIFPGRVYRNETISARAHCTFHQVEGLYIDKEVSFADLKQTIMYFVKEMFGQNTQVRFRPSYFPFTEPSAEIDISCFICEQKGCAVCKKSGWVEIGGCGMVDPAVLENCGIDPKQYSGYAWGMGIERITMLKYQINDLRLYFENDVRFLKQFTNA